MKEKKIYVKDCSMDKIKKNNYDLEKNSKEKFLKEHSIANCIMNFKGLNNISKILNSNTIRLSDIKKKFNENFAIGYIEIWLFDLNDYFNFNRKLTPTQITEIACYIYTDFYLLNLAELTSIFINIKKMKLGALYQNLDGGVIYSYFYDYWSKRIEYLESINKKKLDDKIPMIDRAKFILGNPNIMRFLNELYDRNKSNET